MPTTFGKYVLLRKIAEGGMAEIFLAKQAGAAGFEKLVVVKRILPHLSEEPEFVKMFINEARIAARLHHSNIAQIFDLGRVDNAYFIAMEYVNGEDVAQIAKRCEKSGRGRLPLGVVARVLSDLCSGLHHAHGVTDQSGQPLGLVHRDVSPQNVLATYEGTVKIIDFGVAKATALAGETRAGVMKGKYAYMSPEQCKGEKIDARSDVFAVGIMLWELTAWQRLFKRDADWLTMRAIVEDPVPPVRAIRNDVPEELDQVIAKALAKDRSQRYQTAEELGDAIDEVARKAAWDNSPKGLARLLNELFADKLKAQEEALRGAQAASVEQFLLRVDERTKIDWMPSADSSTSKSESDPMFAKAQQATAVGRPTRATPPPMPAQRPPLALPLEPPPPTTPPPPSAASARASRSGDTEKVPPLDPSVLGVDAASPVGSAPRGGKGVWVAVVTLLLVGGAAAAFVATRDPEASGTAATSSPAPTPEPTPSPSPSPSPEASVAPSPSPAPSPVVAAPARIVLRGQEGVQVFLDGFRKGVTPTTIEEVEPNRPHVLLLIKHGHVDQRLELAPLEPGEEHTVDVALEPARKKGRERRR